MPITLLLSLFAAPAVAQDPEPRLKTVVLDYVAPSGVSRPEAVVREILRDSVRFVEGRLKNSQNPASPFLYLDLDVDVTSGEFERDVLWANDQILQILSGRIAERADNPNKLLVTSDAYLGDYAISDAQGLTNEIRFQSEFSFSQYEHVADAHDLVLLYTLLQDAITLNRSSEVLAAITQAACFAARDIEARASLHADLRRIANHLEQVDPRCLE